MNRLLIPLLILGSSITGYAAFMEQQHSVPLSAAPLLFEMLPQISEGSAGEVVQNLSRYKLVDSLNITSEMMAAIDSLDIDKSGSVVKIETLQDLTQFIKSPGAEKRVAMAGIKFTSLKSLQRSLEVMEPVLRHVAPEQSSSTKAPGSRELKASLESGLSSEYQRANQAAASMTRSTPEEMERFLLQNYAFLSPAVRASLTDAWQSALASNSPDTAAGRRIMEAGAAELGSMAEGRKPGSDPERLEEAFERLKRQDDLEKQRAVDLNAQLHRAMQSSPMGKTLEEIKKNNSRGQFTHGEYVFHDVRHIEIDTPPAFSYEKKTTWYGKEETVAVPINRFELPKLKLNGIQIGKLYGGSERIAKKIQILMGYKTELQTLVISGHHVNGGFFIENLVVPE